MEYILWMRLDDGRQGFVESVGRSGVIVTPDPGAAFSYPDGKTADMALHDFAVEGYAFSVGKYESKEKKPTTGVDKWLEETKEKWSRGIGASTVSCGTRRTRREPRDT